MLPLPARRSWYRKDPTHSFLLACVCSHAPSNRFSPPSTTCLRFELPNAKTYTAQSSFCRKLNSKANWDKTHRGSHHSDVVRNLESLYVKSIYHQLTKSIILLNHETALLLKYFLGRRLTPSAQSDAMKWLPRSA